MDYPPEIERLHQALARLPGVDDLRSGIESLQELTADDLRLAENAHLPHGSLRRTNGGLADEAFIQVEFRVAPTPSGWRSLEFLAWFVRDQARGGESVQLRPFALPPMVGERVQLGETLQWQIDLFCPGTGDDLSPQLARVAKIAESLEIAFRLYGHLLRDESSDLDGHVGPSG